MSVIGHAGPRQSKVTPTAMDVAAYCSAGPATDAVDQAHTPHSGHQEPDAECAAVQRGDHAADAELGAELAQHHAHAEPGDEHAVAECG